MESKNLNSIRIIVKGVKDVCRWKYEGNSYKTECNNNFLLNNDGPYDNNFKFCPYCGVDLHIDIDELPTDKYCLDRVSLNMSKEDYKIIIQVLQDKFSDQAKKKGLLVKTLVLGERIK